MPSPTPFVVSRFGVFGEPCRTTQAPPPNPPRPSFAPFTCEIARRVDRYLEVESALHTVFEPSRVSPGREFFSVTLDQVAAALDLAGGQDVTPESDDDEIEFVVGQTVVDKDGRRGEIERITKAMFHLRDPESGELFSRFKIRPATDPPPPTTSPNPPNLIPSQNEQP